MKKAFQKLIAFFINSPAKRTVQAIGVESERVDEAYIDLKNKIHLDNFVKVPKNKRIVLLPQCLRRRKCKAKKTDLGFVCASCSPKSCQVYKIIKKAKELGYLGTFVLPGGSMVPKVFKKTKPKAVIGVACPKELGLGIPVAEKAGLAVQVVKLKKDGCVDTEVELVDVFEKLEL